MVEGSSTRLSGSHSLRMLGILSILLALLSPLMQVSATNAETNQTTTAWWTGGSGTLATGNYTSTKGSSGTFFVKQGAALTLNVTTANAQCVNITDGTNSASYVGPTNKVNNWVLTGNAATSSPSGGYFDNSGNPSTSTVLAALFTGGSGNGGHQVTVNPLKNTNGNNKCVADQNGNSKLPAVTTNYTLDNTGPTVTGAIAPAPNGAGWNKSDVTITWSATDNTDGSGIASGPSPASDNVTADTTGVTKTSSATDNLGNTGSGTVTVKLDKTAPTISGSRSPAANSNGWNNTNVTVSFSCNDATSGVKSCSGPTTLSAETPAAGTSVTGNAVDNADNNSSTSVGPVKIDKTAPTLSGAPQGSPNGNGWYNSNVAVAWTCSDALSGIDGSCPANTTISGEGSGLTSTASVNDKAGNTTTASSSPAVNIDKTPPVTTAVAPSAWNNTNVTVSLSAADALSGVANTFYTLDGGAQQTGTSVPINTEGDHTLQYWSVDKAGNTEAANTVHVKIDQTPPTITHTLNPAANANGWNNSDVTVTFTCGDAPAAGANASSGVASCTSPQSVTSEGKNQTVTGTATDNAGNTATDPANVSLDKTPPTISASRSPAANSNGWNNTDVTVSFTCGDQASLSGIDICPTSQTVGEAANQSVTGTARDAAGNTAGATVSNINVDETRPTISGAPTTSPNADGWYSGDVTIHWTCSDALSGIDGSCPADSTISGEGSNLSASASVSDKAGNTAGATVSGIKIDRTAPATTAAASPSVDWANTDVTVSLSRNDNLSGVKATYFQVDGGAQQSGTSTTISDNGVHTVKYWSVDFAGNTESANTITVKIDKLSPSITDTHSPDANARGWNNTDVGISFQCADQPDLSGLKSCTSPQTVSTEGQHQVVTGTAVDNAGNSASDPATVNIDKTPPNIGAGRSPAANANGWNNSDVTVTFTCGDALSGVFSCPASSTLSEGANQSVSGTATDNADNTASASIGNINVDETAPTLSGAPTTSPNADGWYNGDVTVTWACADILSGIATDGSGNSTCPADNTFTGEGTNLYVTRSVSDKAGNATSADSAPVNIDRTAPHTTATLPTDWTNQTVTVTLNADDALSGVKTIHYVLDGTAQTVTPSSTPATADVTISNEGTHTLEYWSVDKAGNAEQHHTATVKIDKTAPNITDSTTQANNQPSPNSHGWNNSDVTVTFTCTDPAGADGTSSGIASCTGPQTVTTEGQGQPVTGTALDNAGNSRDDTADVSLDKTPPTISASRAPAANSAGWNNTDVTTSFACADQLTLSGVLSCPDPVTLSTEQAGQSASGTAVDNAGNTASATISNINIDKTPPGLSGSITTTPSGTDGGTTWYNTDVSVAWTCTDTLSGIPAGTCPGNSTVQGEGNNLSASASVADAAGNATTSAVSGIHIDRTAPVTSANAPSGWNNTDVTVNLSAQDGLSGVAQTSYVLDGGAQQAGTTIQISSEGTHTLEFWSVDRAGNVETHHTVTVQIDKTPPTIGHALSPVPNGAGWNNADVTVTFTCADQPGLSGVKSCTSAQTLTTEGKDQAVTGLAVDNAGNSAPDKATVSIDKTKPEISGATDRSANTFNWYNADVTVSFTCTDGLSGIASCSSPTTLSQGADQAVTGTAKDAADNSNTATVSGVNVDETAPTLAGQATTNPNGNGWYNKDVLIHWTAADILSGLNTTTIPGDSTLSTEGKGVQAQASVQDKAGNQTDAASAPVNIDKTAPTITGATDRPANSAGWYNGDVTVTFTCSDGLSGVQTCTAPVHLAQGANQSITGKATDNADNSASTAVNNINVDETKPTLTGQATTAPNANGWYNGDVTVAWTCADALSGLKGTCPSDSTVTGEGSNLSATTSVSDMADNVTTTTVDGLHIDRTAPSTDISAPGAWVNSDVTVTLSPTDNLSGIDATHYVLDSGTQQTGTSVTISSEGTHTLQYWSVDKAGNEETHHAATIKIDKSNPTITHTLNPAANLAGWNNTNVTVSFTCDDPSTAPDGTSSGIASCTAPQTVTTEGQDQPVPGTATDNAGNTASDPATVSIDKTPPTITGSQSPAANTNGWNNTDVTVSFTCDDVLSGIGLCPAATTLHEGAGQSVSGTATDVAGNSASATVSNINVDETAPTINHSLTPAANGAGWNNSSVTVNFSCADQPALSGIASCTGPQSVTTQGAGQTVTGTVTDKAGNSTKDTAAVNIDETLPTISGAPDRPANSYGWYNGDVKVSWTCADQTALSGLQSCTDPTSLGEGASQSVSGTATDNADNRAGATVSGINVDKTAPTISGAPDRAANGNGWYNAPVTVTWTCGDALSGVANCSSPTNVSGEGATLGATGTVSDKAGNSASATVSPIRIDTTAPTTTAQAPAGWVNTNATVTLNPTDNLSGIDSTSYTVDGGPTQTGTSLTISTEGVHTVVFWSVDKAGNVESHKTVQVQVDKSAPTISGAPTTTPNSNGWYNTSVTVQFTCADPKLADGHTGSGIANCAGATHSVTVTSNGANQSATGTATDVAGNTTSATVAGLNIDTVAPVITMAGISDGGVYVLGAVPTASCTATDATSGVDANGCKVTTAGGLANGVGTYTFSATATDKAGNTQTVTGSYRVIYNVPNGKAFFLQPVNDTAHQTGVATSIFKGGQTVPVKFDLTNAAGQTVQANSAPIWLTPVKGSSTAAAVNESAYTTTGDSSSNYQLSGGHYQYNWNTSSSQSGYYWRVGVKLDDGQTYYVNIGLR